MRKVPSVLRKFVYHPVADDEQVLIKLPSPPSRARTFKFEHILCGKLIRKCRERTLHT